MTSAVADSEEDELNERIQHLPQELQDHILDYTIAIEPGVITIDKNYKPPWQLQINRAIRKRTATQHYTTTVFSLDTAKNDSNHSCLKHTVRFLSCLDRDHQSLVAHFQFHSTYLMSGSHSNQYGAWTVARGLYDRLTENPSVKLDKDKFRVSLAFMEGDGQVTGVLTVGHPPDGL